MSYSRVKGNVPLKSHNKKTLKFKKKRTSIAMEKMTDEEIREYNLKRKAQAPEEETSGYGTGKFGQ